MGYCSDKKMVRVDFFKPSGKWYATEAVKWIGYLEPDIHFAFAQSLRNHFKGSNRLSYMDAVCLKPYHKNSHPIQLKEGMWLTYTSAWNH